MNVRGPIGVALSALLFATTASAQDSTPQTPQAPPPPTQPVVVAPPPAPPPAVPVSEVPSSVEAQEEWNTPMFTTGALVFAGAYGGSVIVAGTSDHTGDDRLYVPVLGPWLDLADRGSCPVAQHACDNETTAKVLLVADGVFQAAGLLAMVDGIFVPVHHRVTTVEARREYKKIHVTPASYNGPGFAVMGHF